MQRVYEENEWGKVSKRIVTGYLSSLVSYSYLFFIIIFSSFYNPPFSLLPIYIYLPLYVPTSLSHYHCTRLRFLLTLNST